MYTKIVFAITSDENDLYKEQLHLSLFSLKYYNPKAYVVVVIDDVTAYTNGWKRNVFRRYINEVIVIDTPPGLTKKARSRFIKTSVRQNVSGNYLFIDTDTIVLSDISEIDKVDFEIAAVWDRHVKLKENQYYNSIINQFSALDLRVESEEEKYYNSGVMYVKDCSITYELYKKWHENWFRCYKNGIDIDQPALALSNKELGYVICDLGNEWNCQILGNGLKFLKNAKIIHYFNSNSRTKLQSYPYVLTDSRYLREILDEKGELKAKVIRDVLNARELFNNRYDIVSDDLLEAYNSSLVQFVLYLYAFHPSLFSFVSKICARLYSLYYKIHKISK